MLERKSRIGTTQTKEITIENYVCLLFVLSQCHFCSAVRRIFTTWIARYKGSFLSKSWRNNHRNVFHENVLTACCFFSEPYTPENTLSADHLITLPVFPTQSQFDTSLLSGGVEDSPKMLFFVLFTRKLYSRWNKFLRNFTAWSVRLETALYRNNLFPFFRLPDFCVLGRDSTRIE